MLPYLEVPEVHEHLRDHLVLGADKEAHDIIAQRVPVLVQEALNVVPHLRKNKFYEKKRSHCAI